jgi:hypothetical protein
LLSLANRSRSDRRHPRCGQQGLPELRPSSTLVAVHRGAGRKDTAEEDYLACRGRVLGVSPARSGRARTAGALRARPPWNFRPRNGVERIVRKLLAASIVLLALAACQGDDSPDAVDHPSPDTTSPPSPDAAVSVRLRQIYDMSQGGPIHGSLSYVRAESLDGDEAIEKRFGKDWDQLSPGRFLARTALRLAPGSYRLVSFQRVCDNLCTNPFPPSDECSHTIVVVPDRRVAATIKVRAGEGCAIRVRGNVEGEGSASQAGPGVEELVRCDEVRADYDDAMTDATYGSDSDDVFVAKLVARRAVERTRELGCADIPQPPG